AENDVSWNLSIDQMISNIVYSADGSTLVAVLKDKEFWTLAVNQKKWDLAADKVFDPCISPDGSIVCVVIEKKGQYFLVVNNRIIPNGFDFMTSPVISPDGTKILQKAVKNGVYQRQILSLNKIL
ncbi:MAG: PD40 domain-containing protein, partial [Desulfobacula sp.]|nr:PD40 domain-containing protein [Desulfobacula sp.]